MNRKEAAIAITNEFIDNFRSTIPVSFDNQSTFRLCTTPLTNTTKPSDTPWVTFSVRDNITTKNTIGIKGHRRFRRAGFVSSQVFVPENIGTSTGRDICEEIIDIFEGERIAEDIVFTYGNYRTSGNNTDGWYQYNIFISFTFDEAK